MARTPFSRRDRVSSLVRQVVSELLLLEVSDPRVSGAVVTSVEVTGDLRDATIYVYLHDASRRDAAMRGLERASGFIRRELGKRIQLRVTPAVTFRFDETLERGARIEAQLRALGLGGEESTDESGEDDGSA